MKIAIDGPAGSGKSCVASETAKRLGYVYIDTGAMYRSLAWKAYKNEIDIYNEEELDNLVKTTTFSLSDGNLKMDGELINSEIRTTEISKKSSEIAKLHQVRNFLTKEQRKIAEKTSVVMEGRDIGTVVLQDAEFKFFLKASKDERARRRLKQMQSMGLNGHYEEILQEIVDRDKNDSSRSLAPLKPSKDAIKIDTTNLSIDEVVETILFMVVDD
ncbi:MAG: (d)CMP kinase [Kosmotoga sp.]|nr:MAG: (d)CMP kinase [Kosmotoga sp.]